MNNFAITLRDLGKLNEALLMHGEVLNSRKRTFGEEHPDAILAKNNSKHADNRDLRCSTCVCRSSELW
jgi:hypothetical protein